MSRPSSLRPAAPAPKSRRVVTRFGGRPRSRPGTNPLDVGRYLFGLGMNGSDGADAGPGPTLFRAATVQV